jgi:hypothetical protein
MLKLLTLLLGCPLFFSPAHAMVPTASSELPQKPLNIFVIGGAANRTDDAAAIQGLMINILSARAADIVIIENTSLANAMQRLAATDQSGSGVTILSEFPPSLPSDLTVHLTHIDVSEAGKMPSPDEVGFIHGLGNSLPGASFITPLPSKATENLGINPSKLTLIGIAHASYSLSRNDSTNSLLAEIGWNRAQEIVILAMAAQAGGILRSRRYFIDPAFSLQVEGRDSLNSYNPMRAGIGWNTLRERLGLEKLPMGGGFADGLTRLTPMGIK